MFTILSLAFASTLLVVGPPEPKKPATPPTHSAVTPVPREDGWWLERHAGMNKRVAERDVSLLFIGDSITQGWEDEGKEVWAEFYGKRKAVNLGIGGDRTQHVLWRLDHGNLEGIEPKLAVVMIGTNNSNEEDNTAREIADGIGAIVKQLRAKLPQTKVLVLAIFPRGEAPDAQREKNAAASALVKTEVADAKEVHFLDIGDRFVDKDGKIDPAIMPDFLHLSAKGYRMWAEEIEAKVKDLLGEK